MHMGSSRTYGFADEDDPIVKNEPKKKPRKIQASTPQGSAKKKQKPMLKQMSLHIRKKNVKRMPLGLQREKMS